jgi:alpha-glucosidase
VAPETASEFFERVRFGGEPVADPDSMVVAGDARFTVLTSRLIRLEWSAGGLFEDRGTYAFPTRRAPVRPFQAHDEGGTLTIDTGDLLLRYERGLGRFMARNLAIAFDVDGQRRTWTPGVPNASNLRGTRRTLDECEGDASLDPGLVSRAGWALFDDSRSPVFSPEDGWVAPRAEHDLQDWYFFGYGHDYRGALADYARFGGRIPLIPRFALGAWWSRYWAYSDEDLRRLVRQFENHDLPLDVLVIDMDWHTPHSWTGYTWNRDLFPDPARFLDWAHEKGLRVTLNLHPAEGVQSFEEIYPRFARAMGVDPSRREPIPFRITDRRFVRHYFQLLHHPLEDEGVDFWWIDWQQGETSELTGLDPLPWINHLHFRDSARRGRRPMIYSRWGGLGNHRYPIGFSGDTYATWSALQFQPFFTATASNVLFGWWSHDIGGHMGGATPPELYARWVQFGAMSPCLRLHATKDRRAERRPWKYPPSVFRAAREAFHWRYQLVPYIYTMARLASDTAICLCRPMYYDYPEHADAYVARYQYFFGDQMIAAPIVHPADPQTGMAAVDVWVPEGTWIDYTTRETFTGPRWVRLVGDLERVPMLMRAGGILPLAGRLRAPPAGHLASGTTGTLVQDELVVVVFPGAQGAFRLYEDDGITMAYEEGSYEWTEIRAWHDDQETWTVHIAPAEGRCEALPEQRGYEIRFAGSRRPDQVVVDGVEWVEWTYDPETVTTVVRLPKRDKRRPVTVTAAAAGGISALGPENDRRLALADAERLLGTAFPSDTTDPDALIDAVLELDRPGRADAVARLGGPSVHVLEHARPEEASLQLGTVVVGGPAPDQPPYDVEVVFTLDRRGREERRVVREQALAGSRLIDVPFAFDGRIEAMVWQAEVRITWRGCTMTTTHRSRPILPSVPVWHALIYNQEKPVMPKEVVGPEGRISDDWSWETHVLSAEDLRNLNQPHVLLLSHLYRDRLSAGERLGAVLRTTVVSPHERDAVIVFPPGGPTAFYLNGERVPEAPREEHDALFRLFHHPFRDQLRRTVPVCLRAGANALVVNARAPASQGHWWAFGAVLTDLDGEIMTDLVFE